MLVYFNFIRDYECTVCFLISMPLRKDGDIIYISHNGPLTHRMEPVRMEDVLKVVKGSESVNPFVECRVKGRAPNMKTQRESFFLIACLVVAWMLQGCITGAQLTPKSVDPTVVEGTYTVFFYGCRYPDDIENMAILVDETGPYPVQLYAPGFMYKEKKGLPAAQALAEAKAFITCSAYKVWQSQFRRIPDTADRTIGYEVKPLYVPWEVGVSEALLSSYTAKDGKVVIYIRLDPTLETQRNSGGDGQNPSDTH
jgi:hypothetical protein